MNLEQAEAIVRKDAEWKEVRLKCKTDLMYFGTEVLGYDFTDEVHGPVCDIFVKPIPGVDIEEWDTIKDRLLLDPREHYKTTIDAAHTVQLIIADPNIRVCIFSGAEDLAKQIMNMVKNHFVMNDVFRTLFPEHALKAKEAGNVFEFTTPARTNWKLREPTLSISTIKSVSTGGHYNVIKYDDIVTPQNSETKEMLASTIERVKQTHPLLIVGGYRDFIGTRYDFSDAYGWILDTCDDSWKVFKREAYYPSVDDAGTPIPPSKESTILFTVNRAGKKAFDYKELLKRYKSMGPGLFGRQYLNNPQWGETSAFPEKLMREACIPFSAIPLIRRDPLSGQLYKNLIVFIAWDLAFSKKKQADYTVGIVGGYDNKGKLYILDLVRDRFNADEFVLQFFTLFRKWMLFMGRVGIEETAGAPLIEPSLRSHAAQLQVGLPVDWLPVARDTSKNERVFGLLPLLKNKRLFFNKDIPDIEQLIKEFVRFPRYSHDDIPDACQMLLNFQELAPMTAANRQQFPTSVPNPRYQPAMPLGYGLTG